VDFSVERTPMKRRGGERGSSSHPFFVMEKSRLVVGGEGPVDCVFPEKSFSEGGRGLSEFGLGFFLQKGNSAQEKKGEGLL